MDCIKTVTIDSEDEVNATFTLTYDDGTVRKYWSCDQGSLEVADDGEYDLTEEEHGRLFDLWFSMDVVENSDEIMVEDFNYISGKRL